MMSETTPTPRTPFTFSKTGFRGVYWEPSRQVFRVQIGSRRMGTLKRIGRFLTDVEAAEAYDIAAMELYGEGAILNFPLAGYKTIIPVYGQKTHCAAGHEMDDANCHYLVLMAEAGCHSKGFASGYECHTLNFSPVSALSVCVDHWRTIMTDNLTDQTIANIVQTWKGGEHRLAGRRASELAFGSGKTANQAVVDKLQEECPGIGEFISVPEVPVNWVNADRPAFKTDDDFSNKSPDSSKADQDAIDKTLEAGRKRSEQAPEDQNLTGSTKLNPSEDPVAEPKGKPGKK